MLKSSSLQAYRVPINRKSFTAWKHESRVCSKREGVRAWEPFEHWPGCLFKASVELEGTKKSMLQQTGFGLPCIEVRGGRFPTWLDFWLAQKWRGWQKKRKESNSHQIHLLRISFWVHAIHRAAVMHKRRMKPGEHELQLLRTFSAQWSFKSELSCNDVLVLTGFVKQKLLSRAFYLVMISEQAGGPALKEKSGDRSAWKHVLSSWSRQADLILFWRKIFLLF